MSRKELTFDWMKLYMIFVALALSGIIVAVWLDNRLNLAEQIVNTIFIGLGIMVIG